LEALYAVGGDGAGLFKRMTLGDGAGFPRRMTLGDGTGAMLAEFTSRYKVMRLNEKNYYTITYLCKGRKTRVQ
jgi:hypothetical protein